MDTQIPHQVAPSHNVQQHKDRQALSAIESRAEQRASLQQQAALRTASEGAQQLAEAISRSLQANDLDDQKLRNRENRQARTLETQAYKKLAAVGVDQARALVAAQRARILDDHPLQIAMELNETKLAAAHNKKAKVDKAMALADLGDFRQIQSPSWQEHAAVQMTHNMHAYPQYKEALASAGPSFIERLTALDKANTERSMAKEQRKAADYVAAVQQRLDQTRTWTPEAALSQVRKDVAAYQGMPDRTEQGFMRDDMAANANASPSYQQALQQTAPALAKHIQAEQHQALPLDDAALERLAANRVFDAAALQRIAAARARESAHVRQALGLNAIEPTLEQQRRSAQEAAPSAAVTQTPAAASAARDKKPTSGNKVESDEIFTARQMDPKPVVPPDIEKCYLRVGDKFYHPKNTDLLAFEDKGNKLETRSNSEAIAESMVRIAHARGWDEIKVTGSEVFRREVWLVAASRGMHVKGYTPSERDKAVLAQRGANTERNQVEPSQAPLPAPKSPGQAPKPDHRNLQMAQAFAGEAAVAAIRKHPELAGSVVAVAAMDIKAQADGLSSEQRRVVAARVRHNVINSIERGTLPDVQLRESAAAQRHPTAEKEYLR